MAKLGDICFQITDGSHNPPAGIENSKHLMLSSKNINDDEITTTAPRFLTDEQFDIENKRTNVLSGDLLMTIVGTVGRVAVVPEMLAGICLQRSVAVIKPNPTIINNRYLMYQLQSMRKFLESEARGVAQKGIYLKQVGDLSVITPPLDEQYRVVDTLDHISGLIHIYQQQLTKLDELIKARFVEMFGDVISNSNLWPICKFSEITSSRLGKMLDAKQQTGVHRYPYLANFNVQWFRFELKTLNSMDFNESDRIEFELHDGDLLVCEGGEIGRCAVWHNNVQPCYFQKALHRVRCNKDFILPDFLAWWFKYNCDHGGFSAIEGAKATIAHLPGAKLKNLDVCVPPLPLQNQFATFVEEVDKSKADVQKALDQTQLLFDSLMQQYFG